MARKATYLYKVRMDYNNGLGIVDYCYARNAEQAIDGMKAAHADEHFSSFKPVCFAEADIEQHPEYFALLNEEERKIIEDHRLATADKYSVRKAAESFNMNSGTFISKEEMETWMQ